jgi:RNA polymerase sigma factor (sigma-70 family)
MSNTVSPEWDKYYVNNDEALALLRMWRNCYSAKDRAVVEKQIIHRLSYLVYAKIHRYANKHYYEDLLQEGRAGLLESVRKFDPSRGINFFKYGCWHIQSRIGRFLKKQIRRDKREVLSAALPGQVLQVVEHHVSPEDLYEEEEGKRVLVSALGSLPEIDRKVVLMRFGIDGSGGCTYKQIGDVFSVSRQRIEQITSRAISRLRKNTQIKDFFCEL